MNQITPTLPVALLAGISTVDHNLDRVRADETAFRALTTEIEGLRTEIEQLTIQNEDLKQTIDSIYASPTDKRKLLIQVERKYGISRRRVCRLLSFARSTCWYRPAAGPSFLNADQGDITALSSSALVQRLKKLARQAENGFLPLDENLQTQFEYGLNKIGLQRAAYLAQNNLKLAMEIFSAWCEQAKV